MPRPNRDYSDLKKSAWSKTASGIVGLFLTACVLFTPGTAQAAETAQAPQPGVSSGAAVQKPKAGVQRYIDEANKLVVKQDEEDKLPEPPGRDNQKRAFRDIDSQLLKLEKSF